jgi:hypothetical protein
MLPILGCLKSKRETLIRERFFLGGVASLRGFAFKGVGPHAERRSESGSHSQPGQDALGGDLFATVRSAVRVLCSDCMNEMHHCATAVDVDVAISEIPSMY